MRLKKLINLLKREGSLPYLVSDLVNIKYLTGYAGTYAYLVVGREESFFISDSRYEEYARSILSKPVEFVLQKSDFLDCLRGVLKRMGARTLHLEGSSTPLSAYRGMTRSMRGVRLKPGGDEVSRIRMVKDDEELLLLRQAARITDACVDHLREIVRPGISEWDVAVEIEHFYRTHGCRRSSFDSIVASGAGSSMPHYATSMSKKISAGEVLLIDMGCEYQGYNSDLTRTMFVRSVDPRLERVYRIVKKAQEEAIRSVKPGISVSRLDAAARDIIADEGYGDNFGPGLGHGIGLDVHEPPAIKKKAGMKLKKNMAITIEPGIYLPGIGGVRIEDMVVVTARGCEVLTSAPKDIVVIG
jgi:Xaa-Pro aminopeptidase